AHLAERRNQPEAINHSSASLRSEEEGPSNLPLQGHGTPRVHDQPEHAFTLARTDRSDSPEYARPARGVASNSIGGHQHGKIWIGRVLEAARQLVRPHQGAEGGVSGWHS